MQRRIGRSRLNINRSREPDWALSPRRGPPEAGIGNALDERFECGEVLSMRVKAFASLAWHGCGRGELRERAFRGMWPSSYS